MLLDVSLCSHLQALEVFVFLCDDRYRIPVHRYPVMAPPCQRCYLGPQLERYTRQIAVIQNGFGFHPILLDIFFSGVDNIHIEYQLGPRSALYSIITTLQMP